MYSLSCAGSWAFSRGSSDDADAVYVLDLLHLPAGLAATCSDQQLSLFDPECLRDGPIVTLPTNHGSVRALEAFDWAGSVVATAGDDGQVNVWDMRQGSQVGGLQAAEKPHAILSLACLDNTVAVGTDLQNHTASIAIWDLRAPAQLRQYKEVHSDDVTELKFYNHLLLSGSTDGLVNICDTRVADEDEVVVETFNHGASIHRAGRLGASVFALSHDERFAVYGDEPDLDFGDLREGLGCRYVANVTTKIDGSGAVLGVGGDKTFDLVFLSKDKTWTFDDHRVGLDGAHGTDVVRAFCLFDQEQVVFSAGEDGQIKAWR